MVESQEHQDAGNLLPHQPSPEREKRWIATQADAPGQLEMELTQDQQKALVAVRKAVCERLGTFYFTEDMLKDKSLFQLLNLLQLLIGHRNYLGMFSHTCMVLEEIFGTDAFWNKPSQPEPDEQPEQKPVVN